jgi:hypothetical protein
MSRLNIDQEFPEVCALAKFMVSKEQVIIKTVKIRVFLMDVFKFLTFNIVF